ncbi:MAG TPA: uroporphyrinogen-III synthase [Burkholderiales bacterium]|nr:uroporphyrinogen-III synthase [Burkholderiales bacterium]
MSAGPLSGRGIVITRPREHALALAERIRSAGGDPILFPTIEILPPEREDAVSRIIARLEGYQLAIFVSPTAALRGHALVSGSRSWPEGLRVAAVGAGTAKALAERGFRDVISPEGEADSEALAALAELRELHGCAVVIFRGQGGREWLGHELEARGARVEYAECYRRARPGADARGLLPRWQTGGIEAVSITSAEGLANFFAMLGPTGGRYLRATPVFVPHRRIEAAARGHDVREIIVTGRGDERTVAEMAAFFAGVV